MDTKYNFTNNTYIAVPKSNKKDKIEIEIGDIKQKDFYPQVKIKRWDNEVNCSVRLIDSENNNPLIFTEDNKIIWDKSKRNINFYNIPISDSFPEGGYEFEITLKEKPISNKVEFTIRTKGIDFYFQPELTEEEIKNNHIRPENVINSYAAYYSDCPHNSSDGKEYKCGKAFHIYRPRVEDAEGNWVWGKLNVDNKNEILTVEIPQDFLDNAKYPVHHAAGLTFGYTGTGASYANQPADDITGGYGTGVNNATVSKISAYSAMASTNGNMKGVLVKASDKTIVTNGVSDVKAVTTTPAWWEATYSTAPAITATNYYPSVITSQILTVAYDAGQPSGTYYFYDSSNSYSSPTNPTDGAATNNYRVSMYATYNYNIAVITIQSYTKSKISDETGMTTSTVTFRSSMPLLSWEARADGNGHGNGTLVGSGSAVAANSNVSFDITYDELTGGDKTYRINIYGENESGLWSVYE